MVIAWLVVRKNFSGKEALDFSSNLGGAVPGTILGIGFILVFNKPPLALAVVIYALLALFFVLVVGRDVRERLIILLVGTTVGVLFTRLQPIQVYYLLGGLYLLIAVILFLSSKRTFGALFSALLGLYVMSTNWATAIAQPIADLSRSIERGFWSNAIFQFSDHIKVLFQPPASLLAIFLIFAGILLVQGLKNPLPRLVAAIMALSIPCAMSFMEIPFALVGGAYIIMAAFVIRSLPASVRAGVASLQQIDPSIEEASNILGGDAQYTFRKVTLPLILPALIAGLIFSFTRHMTSLSAIVFLISAKWRIVTASILSEWEQGGVSIAAAYSTLIILLVLIAIALLNVVTNRLLRGREGVDLSQGL
jgi:iron(III) transport system permease protein